MNDQQSLFEFEEFLRCKLAAIDVALAKGQVTVDAIPGYRGFSSPGRAGHLLRINGLKNNGRDTAKRGPRHGGSNSTYAVVDRDALQLEKYKIQKRLGLESGTTGPVK